MGEAKQKGDLLEDVVALLHERSDAHVDVRIKLPVADVTSQRRREIDVLLTSHVTGFPIQVAIECKNEKDRVGIEKIDALVGKLLDVGIPPVHGIYVSPIGYTSGALERAKVAGIRTLLFEGLTADRLKIEISIARQSIVYALATWHSMNPFLYTPKSSYENLPGITVKLDLKKHGHDKPGLLNVLWELWITEKISGTLGEHVVSVILPPGYSIAENETDEQGGIVIIEYRVVGHILQRKGHARNLRLKNAETKEVETQRIDASFRQHDTSDDLIRLESEEELAQYIGSGDFHIYGRIRVPRIVDSKVYWPLSKRALQRIRELHESGSEITFAKIEGTDLSRAWETYFETNA